MTKQTATPQPPAIAQPEKLPALPGATPPGEAKIAAIPAPPEAPAPPPPPPISDKADTVAAPMTNGLRVEFASGQSDLSPASATAIKDLVGATASVTTASFNVLAYAAPTPDDPSTARRLSLSRALAVRSALLADGVPSPRIFVRALGPPSGEGPADRVDLAVTPGGAAPAGAPK